MGILAFRIPKRLSRSDDRLIDIPGNAIAESENRRYNKLRGFFIKLIHTRK